MLEALTDEDLLSQLLVEWSEHGLYYTTDSTVKFEAVI